MCQAMILPESYRYSTDLLYWRILSNQCNFRDDIHSVAKPVVGSVMNKKRNRVIMGVQP